MENMLHLSSSSHESLPENFAVPPEQQLPPPTSAVVSLPVIDMSGSRDEVRRAILDAGKELGFFQVVNHGVPEQVMRDMEAVGEEFFQLPAADKAEFYSEDRGKPSRLFSGTSFDTGGEEYRRECLRLSCTSPMSDSTKDWPNKPRRLRCLYAQTISSSTTIISIGNRSIVACIWMKEIVEKYIMLAKGVGMEVLRLLCEGMGLQLDYFEGDLSGGALILEINHYPSCRKPSMTLGLPPHCDRDLITLLLPGPVHGLEVAYKGDWVRVKPMPSAFVVNFGLQLEVVTNGMLKSIEHRVMTNTMLARTSISTFIQPTEDCLVGPAEEFLSEDNPPHYRTHTYGDFMRIYNIVNLGSSVNHTTNLRKIQKEM
ncbi:hypothetical protein ACP70R_018744 [Stipagrostis hirtigluma subsp. patula]